MNKGLLIKCLQLLLVNTGNNFYSFCFNIVDRTILMAKRIYTAFKYKESGTSVKLLIKSVFILFLLVFACKPNQKSYHQQLLLIDSLITVREYNVAADSLSQVKTGNLDRKNYVYYQLLEALNYHNLEHRFTNDSILSMVVDFYNSQKITDNYLRALLLLSIARNDMQLTDSLIYNPLKTAENIILENPQVATVHTQVRILNQLGRINERHENYKEANCYFEKGKKLAIKVDDKDQLVVNSLALFWNHLRYRRYEEARLILAELDTISEMPNERKFNLINAKATYFHIQQDYDSALVVYNEMEKLAHNNPGNIRFSSIYYFKSMIYKSLNQPDSALSFAQKAVESITDTVFTQKNYYLYEHLANIAYEQKNFRLSSDSYKDAFNSLMQTLNDKTEKRILELEKQYDYSRVELAALRQKQESRLIILIISFIAFVMALVIVIYKQQLKQNKTRLEKETILRENAELEAKQNEREKIQKEQLIMLYHHLAQRHVRTQEIFEQLSYKYLKVNPDIHDDIQVELTELKSEFNSMLNEIVHDELLYSYINIPSDVPLTGGERVILFLLYCQMPSKQLTTLLGINAGNLRVRKSNLRRKLSEYQSKIPNFEQILSLF